MIKQKDITLWKIMWQTFISKTILFGVMLKKSFMKILLVIVINLVNLKFMCHVK